jgi:competence protein ComEA
MSPQQRWLVPTLAAIGGVGLGVALVALVALLLGAVPQPGRAEPFGVRLGSSMDSAFAGTLDSDGAMSEPAGPTELVVDVAGAVVRPGLQRLHPGDRVGDAIAAAGGYAPRVDLARASESLNLAQPLADGVKVLVPELGIDARTGPSEQDARIDVNRADQGELETLPGIGPVTARKIMEARTDAPFDSVRQLRARGVVGDSVFDDIKDLVRVSS